MDTAEIKKTENTQPAAAPKQAPFAGQHGRFQRPQRSFGGDKTKNPRKSSGRGTERIKPEFDQKILNIRRVTRVTKGGRE